MHPLRCPLHRADSQSQGRPAELGLQEGSTSHQWSVCTFILAPPPPAFMGWPLSLAGCHEGLLPPALGWASFASSKCVPAGSSYRGAEHGQGDKDRGESNAKKASHAQTTKWFQAFSCLTLLLNNSYTAAHTHFWFDFGFLFWLGFFSILFDFVFYLGCAPRNAGCLAGPSLCVGSKGQTDRHGVGIP